MSFDIKFTRQGFDKACWHREACQDIENTRWVSCDIKFIRQGFDNACWHREACQDIENTRWVSFDMKFTSQDFDNACWHSEACPDTENTRSVCIFILDINWQSVSTSLNDFNTYGITKQWRVSIITISPMPLLLIWIKSDHRQRLRAKQKQNKIKSKEDGENQVSIQSNTTPEQGHHMGMWQNTRKHHKPESQEVSLFTAGDHKDARNSQGCKELTRHCQYGKHKHKT